MGFLDKFIYADPDGEKQKREEKKAAKNETPTPVGVQPLVNSTIQPVQYTQVQTTPQSFYGNSVPDEELAKCQNYFGILVDGARKQSKLYDQFLTSLEKLKSADASQPIQNVAKFAFAYLQMADNTVTKEKLLQDIQNAYNIVSSDRTGNFKNKQDMRRKEGIEDNDKLVELKRKQILDKQNEIKMLNDEINQLTQVSTETNRLIAIKETCYNMVSDAVSAKFKEEINLINYIN